MTACTLHDMKCMFFMFSFKRAIEMHYLKGWFAIDVVSILPFYLFELMGSGPCMIHAPPARRPRALPTAVVAPRRLNSVLH